MIKSRTSPKNEQILTDEAKKAKKKRQNFAPEGRIPRQNTPFSHKIEAKKTHKKNQPAKARQTRNKRKKGTDCREERAKRGGERERTRKKREQGTGKNALKVEKHGRNYAKKQKIRQKSSLYKIKSNRRSRKKSHKTVPKSLSCPFFLISPIVFRVLGVLFLPKTAFVRVPPRIFHVFLGTHDKKHVFARYLPPSRLYQALFSPFLPLF